MKKYLLYILILIALTGIFSPMVKVNAQTKYEFLAPLTEQPTFNPEQPNALGGYLDTMIKIFIGLCAVLSVVMIIVGGLEYMTSELAHTKEAGKERMWQAVLGLLIALGAYALLNTINPDLLNTELKSLKKIVIEVTLNELSNGSYGSSGGAGAGGEGGACSSIEGNPNNPCSTAKLTGSCFGNRASEASQICNMESADGKTDVKSDSDHLNNGIGPSYSIGLWQVNLTVHKVGGLDCPSAFTGKCGKGTATPSNAGPFVGGPKVGNCSVTIKPDKMQLYNDCVNAAQDPVKNTQVACNLYSSYGFDPWRYSANKCGVP